MQQSIKNIVWFVLKPSAISNEIRRYFESCLCESWFRILWVVEKKLTTLEVDYVHCVVWPRKCNEQEYKEYMTSWSSIWYLVEHDSLSWENLFSFCSSLRGVNVEAYACKDQTLRKQIHEYLIMAGYIYKSSVENHVHVTDSQKELIAFLNIYFPNKQL